jgi:hypothetical protein
MSTHSSKAKSRQVKITTHRKLIFLYFFDKNDASKNKVKEKLKQIKGCACKTPLAEVFFLPGNGARKQLDGQVLIYRSPTSWEPQEEGMMSTAAVFPQ